MKRFELLAVMLFWFSIHLFAFGDEKNEGIISGKVVMQITQQPITGVNILVVGTTFGAVTDSTGSFKIQHLPMGRYAVRASAVGFESRVITDVIVSVVKPAVIHFELAEKSVDVKEVTIQGEYFHDTPDVPVSARSQSYEELRRLPGGFEDVVRAVSILPGVAQVQVGRNDLVVRGGAPSENLFLINNFEVPNINHFGTQGASGGPLSYINLDFVEGTTFSSGGFGVRYGDRLSSLLAINLREGRRDRLGAKATISATQFGLTTEGPVNENGSFLFSARRSYLDFIFKAAGLAFTPQYWDFTGKADYHLSQNDQLSILGIGILDNIKLFDDSRDHIYDNSRVLLLDQNQSVAGIAWKHLLSSGFSNVVLSNTYNEYHYTQNDTILRPIFTNVSRERISTLLGEFVWQPAQQSELSFGAEGKFIQIATDLAIPSFWTNYGVNLSLNTHADTNAYKGAGYIQFIQTVGSFQGTLGARWDYFNLISHGNTISPRFSLSYKPWTQTKLTMSIGRYAQAPSYIWLVANANNRNLTYIEANEYVLGIDHVVRSDMKINIEGYVKQYSDYPASTLPPYLVLSNSGTGYGGSDDAFASFGIDPLVSAGRGEAHGIELFIQKKLSESPYYGIISVSFNETDFSGLDGITHPGSFDQRWIINFGGGYIINDDWEFAARFRFATGRPYTPYNSDGTQSSALFNAARVGVNHSLDVRADRRWVFSNWTLITFLDIQNIYNKKPVDIPLYNERLGHTEERPAIGILPSIGISAEF
ncbi:MAG: carboxypeptidase-like regulatory domain-containing protein [Bacteroidota bacterium]